MSDYSSMATLQNNSQTAGFAAAVQRARLVAAKIEGGGSKRPLEEGPEPNAKKLASVDSYQQQQPQQGGGMSGIDSATVAAAAAAAAAAARLASAGAPAVPPSALMQDQTINEYIRVPDKMVGLIIGRGGEQITRLQAESGCKIQMAPDSGGQPDRMCTLTGSREAITRAKDLVNQIVNHRGRENALPHSDGPGMGGGMPPMPRGGGGMGGGGGGGGGGLATDEIMLPGPKVGLIIGKSGKTIKQLQEQSGAKMVVIQDGPNTEYEKPLRISGDPSKVEHAKQLVYELLADKDMQGGGGAGGGGGNQRQYDDPYSPQEQDNGLATNSTEVLVPKGAVGVVIGRGGEMIKKIQAETGARVQFHQERDDGPGDKRCYLQGKPHQVDQARQMIEDLISSVNRRAAELRGPRGRSGSGQRNGEREPAWPEQEMRVTFTVSNMKCGLIIGRGGEVIKQINAVSGAHCELDRRAQGADRNNRTFYIKGHPDAVDHCKRIIMEKVGMPVNFILESGNGGNGGGPGSGGGSGGAEYYGGAPPAWGYNPHWHQPNNQQQPQQQQPQVQINPSTGQPDYSRQWIEYYRSLGLVREAEAIEQQAKQQQQQQQQPQQPQQPQGGGESRTSAPLLANFSSLIDIHQTSQTCSSDQGSTSSNGSASAPPAVPTQDYSAQWAEYYRSIGKVKEAEAIEAQILIKQPQQSGAAPPAPASPLPGGVPQYGAQYPYPGACPPYNPYPYQAAPAQDHRH